MKIAIKANPSRGKEIISLLENLGGIKTTLKGNGKVYTYYIDEHNVIMYHDAPTDYKVYTLEEFEKEFPFKVGDEVMFPAVKGWLSGKIIGLDYAEDQLKYKIRDRIGGYSYVKPHKLNLYPMKEERNITLTLDKAKEWYKKGGELKEIALQAFKESELNLFPRSWEEFCEKYSKIDNKEYFIDSNSSIIQATAAVSNYCRLQNGDRNICPSEKSAEAHLAMIQLEQLRDCWRQGWKPKWMGESEKKYAIKAWRNEYTIQTTYNTHEFLTFPTYEMAEEFLKCFKDLIEKAGDLI